MGLGSGLRLVAGEDGVGNDICDSNIWIGIRTKSGSIEMGIGVGDTVRSPVNITWPAAAAGY